MCSQGGSLAAKRGSWKVTLIGWIQSQKWRLCDSDVGGF